MKLFTSARICNFEDSKTNSKMEKKSRSLGVSDWIVIIGVIIIVAVLLFIDSRDMGSKQIVVVVISSVASAVVTYLLLRGQKHDLEEQREKDNKLIDERRNADQAREDERRKIEIEREEARRESDRLFEDKRLAAEEKRSKGVQIYSNKISAFSAFNEAVWQYKLDWSEEKGEVINNIRKELFS